ncbi:MerR family DNA-binding transcriptional regulator [Laceyella sacchari]|jgi:MerR family transcriptional regulator, global nitrogen regulator|uniref:Transcriptional regulator n=2 Tax=Laceyella TaxID=292635 RepID=A0AA45WM80_9BACL|nr:MULTISPECIES: MerR family transcriptional regulator [Laceyella]AUS09543.1 MerR family DNA-binding transcriptional regulator [Laceyella sacchari]MRG27749.1 MerR family transcriptional regulator [Laceyella tengchongensis]PRZ17220.1 transcriptional regulator [Laceyella sediminis]SMP13381.1 transcriptional regulator [Laceyella tengchongensis]
MSYKDRKVINIGTVSEMTGLSVRQIRYYEERQLIFPERTKGGTRKFSFSDIEKLMDIANHIEDGLQTVEIKRMESQRKHRQLRNQMIRGQINAAFGMRK